MKNNIIKINHSSDLKDLDVQFADLISQRLYPLTSGVPFCVSEIQHNIDLFKGTGKGDKCSNCDECKLKSWCNYNSEINKAEFDIVALTEVDKDLLEFLEDRDEDSSNWF